VSKKSLLQAKVHFIGVGGIGMSGLAELLYNMGAAVTGSDLALNAQTSRLSHVGVRVFQGHRADHVGDVDVVVYSSAVRPDNPEFAEARRRKIPVIPRAEALAEIMNLKRGIAVAGTHGKTTTTSLTASVFLSANLDPTIVVGGRLDVIKSTAWLGKGDWLIAEADESDGSFSRLNPEIAVITNIDDDHLDHYGSFASLQQAFYGFATRIPFYGALIACGDDPVVREVFAGFNKQVVFYGFEPANDFHLHGERGVYGIFHHDRRVGEIKVPMPGRHNALNSLAAYICGLKADIDPLAIRAGLEGFKGVDRRFQFKGSREGVDFYDDYGHHPTEIRAVLQAFREKFPTRRLVVVFQPHRFSRTRLCWESFKTCFAQADALFLLDIYAAGEPAIEGINSESLSRAIAAPRAVYLREFDPEALRRDFQAGDIVITLGAGSISSWGERLYRP
jgi:UDP-N-acetylmuramate--alanine ligase